MSRAITISTDVFAAIWAKRQTNEDSEDAILRRMLGCPKINGDDPAIGSHSSEGGGVQDMRNDVHFQEGFEIFRNYRGREYRAEAQNGAWVRKDTGARFPTLNQLNSSIAKGSENVWNGNWKYRAHDKSIRSINELRH